MLQLCVFFWLSGHYASVCEVFGRNFPGLNYRYAPHCVPLLLGTFMRLSAPFHLYLFIHQVFVACVCSINRFCCCICLRTVRGNGISERIELHALHGNLSTTKNVL